MNLNYPISFKHWITGRQRWNIKLFRRIKNLKEFFLLKLDYLIESSSAHTFQLIILIYSSSSYFIYRPNNEIMKLMIYIINK